MLVSQGEQLGLPGGELSDVSLHLSSDILQTLCDGWLAGCAADTHCRGEVLLHAGHLSHNSCQLVEGWTARDKIVPVENNNNNMCCILFLSFVITTFRFHSQINSVIVCYHVCSTLSEVCCATLSSSTFRLWVCFNIAVTRWFSWHQAASPLRIRQPGGCRWAASGDGHLSVCCLQLLVSSFCWGSSGQHCSSQASCCRRVLHWAARDCPLLTQPWREAWGGSVQPASALWFWRWVLTSWTLLVSLLCVVRTQGKTKGPVTIVGIIRGEVWFSNQQHWASCKNSYQQIWDVL